MFFDKDHQQANKDGRLPAPSCSQHQAQLLAGKVVLVVGGKTAVLENLIMRLAEKGASVVLLCWSLPHALQARLKEFTFAAGQWLFVIEQANNYKHSTDQLVRNVLEKWGKFDFFIDLSAQKSQLSQIDSVNDALEAEWMKKHWQITQAILQSAST